MHSFRKLAYLAVCPCLLAGGFTVAGAEGDKPKNSDKKPKVEKAEKSGKPGKKDKKKKPKEGQGEEASATDAKMSLPLAEGHDSLGLRIPYTNAEGVLQMVFNVGRASRIDQNLVRMTDLQVETFDEEGASEMVIDLPTSVLNLNTSVITTDKHVTIRRSDFEISGKTMEFNTKTKQGTLGGDVRMLIYGEISGEKADGTKKTETQTP